jgi:hypothetical protein
MALYIPRSIFLLARLLYVRPETFGPTLLSESGLFGGKNNDQTAKIGVYFFRASVRELLLTYM